jgi:hypothetical protein
MMAISPKSATATAPAAGPWRSCAADTIYGPNSATLQNRGPRLRWQSSSRLFRFM